VSLFVLIGITILTCVASLCSVGYSGIASASPSYTTTQANTPTPNPLLSHANPPGQTTDNTATAPSPVTTQEGENAPTNVPTGGPTPLPTDQALIGGTTGNTTGGNAPSSGGFPWLIVGLVVLVVLAGLVFAALRQRRTATAIEGTATQVRPGTGLRAPSTTAPGPAVTQTTERTATSAAAPAMVQCPNCGTSNAVTERYCHECGQDLRPVIAQSATVTAPPASPGAEAPPPADMIAEDTPYFETLDMVDEQLEFVLSRPRILIGTAPNNDIVINSAFKGWQTVSPQHAELRREQDTGFVIVDRESEYGTFVNEMRTGENILSDGDLVRLGDVRFVFRVPKSDGTG
jgi:hypothetical protein